MSRFIKLTRSLINTKYIREIVSHDEMYKLHYYDGILGFNIFMLGFVFTNEKEITICRNKHPKDYKIMTEWVEKQDNN